MKLKNSEIYLSEKEIENLIKKAKEPEFFLEKRTYEDNDLSVYRFFNHEETPDISNKTSNFVISQEEIDNLYNEGKAALVPFTVPYDRSFAIVELQDLTSEKRITNLLYDAVYEGIPISDLKIGLEIVGLRVLEKLKEGKTTIILSDYNMYQYRIPIPLPLFFVYLQNLLSENKFNIKDIEIYVETGEIFNPYDIATLIVLGARGVYPYTLSLLDNYKHTIEILNRILYDINEKKGYQNLLDIVGSNNVKISGLKNEFLKSLNPTFSSEFEIYGLSEIESYIYENYLERWKRSISKIFS